MRKLGDKFHMKLVLGGATSPGGANFFARFVRQIVGPPEKSHATRLCER